MVKKKVPKFKEICDKATEQAQKKYSELTTRYNQTAKDEANKTLNLQMDEVM